MKKILFVLALFLSISGFSQQININQHFKEWKPRNIGPSGMSGRIVAIDAVHKNPNIIYLGAASGGVWKTVNGGSEWTPIFDEESTLNIGSLTIQQSNPAVIWVGTGEGNPRNSLNIGEGIYRTLDAGKTWKLMGLEKTKNIHRVIIDPNNPNIIYAAAIGNPFGEHPDRGVYKTTDGGETWNKILYVNDTTGCAELVMDPSNPNKLIASMWQHRRQPWTFKSGGTGSGLYMTVDGGKTWKKMGKEEGIPDGQLGRIGLAFSRSMPSRVYAKIESTKNGFYRSDDGGFKWTLVNSDPAQVTDRPFYYQEIYVDPQNENRIYDIHSTVTYSEDAGKSFQTLIPYSGIHPDHHAWWIDPNNPNFIIEGNDGGIGISRDRGANWVFDEKIPVGQFYHINVDNQMPYNVMGGMQDNGSWRGPAYTLTTSGIRNYYWENVGGGDGFDVMPDPDDNDWVYSMSQGGSVGKQNVRTGDRWFIKPPGIDMSTKLRFNWNSAIAQDPHDTKTIYFGSQFLHRSNDKGASWQTISPDLTMNNPEQQKQDETGGLTLDITGAETFNTIITIAPSAKQSGVVWVGTDDGNVQLTTDAGKTWTNFRGKIPGLTAGAWIPQIQASRHNAGEAFVVANDYRRADFKPYIFRTTDFGKTWTRLVDENKVRGYALCVIQDPTEPNLIFVGTEHGLWVSLNNGASFQQWKNGYPSVSTYDLAIQEREADLAIATFGRSLWILDDIRPLRKLAASKGTLAKALTMYPIPDAHQIAYRPATGYEWSVAGLWDAENRRRGAPISFSLNKTIAAPATPTRDTVAAPQPATGGQGRRGGGGGFAGRGGAGAGRDSVLVRIYNDKNELIRNTRWRADTGFNRVYWGMEEKGFRQPGSPKPRPGAPEPGGLQVLPGTYKVVLSSGRDTDSGFITIKDDPRLGNRNEAKLAQRATYARLRKSTEKLTEALDRLTDASDLLTKMNSQLLNVEGKEADSLRKNTKALQDSVKSIREFISGTTSDRQGISRSQAPTVMTRIQEANQNIGSKPLAPGAQEIKLIENAEKLITDAVQRTNALFEGKWKSYRMQVENTKINLFKDYKPIE
ncbi:MAG: hypothetical protein H7Y31_14555 [Chitinophagaceae bacterium]|nr:hypothetical protein [Chitinophagaceae bacterium]